MKFTENIISIIPRDFHGPVVEVTWLRALDYASPLSDFYSETFSTLEGVESVVIGRYSALIEVAGHIATVDEIAENIYEQLTTPQAAEVLHKAFPEDNWKVQPPFTAVRRKEEMSRGKPPFPKNINVTA